tara:strand:+ start:589 stop:1869 length:1281 start_codon:yes stop_codon:yes gene_type:complete
MTVHHGPLFGHKYICKQLSIKYDNRSYPLSPEAEQAAILFAHVPDKHLDKVFISNFTAAFKKLASFCYVLQKCDFSPFKTIDINYEPIPKGVEDRHKYCYIKGKKLNVHNYIVEPTCIFKGRGLHPKRGTIKTQVKPADFTINASVSVDCPNGCSWGKVINNPSVAWLASYKDSLGITKYIYADQPDNLKKFEVSRKLKYKIKGIRESINDVLCDHNSSTKYKQLACATWLIDKLLIRVGNEKTQLTADTVGVCTLRCEHVTLLSNMYIRFHFKGKDSIIFNKKIKCPTNVYNSIKSFVTKPTCQLFTEIDADTVNKFLSHFMQNLTAKVFRTFHASRKFQSLLSRCSTSKEYKKANKEIGKLCNHMLNRNGKLHISSHTSKVNYIDPRITFAFAKKHKIDINELLPTTLLKLHKWASSVDESFSF